MVEEFLVVAVKCLFVVIIMGGTLLTYLTWQIMRLMKTLNPKKHHELSSGSVLGGWINSSRFKRFVRSNDGFPDQKLAWNLRIYRSVDPLVRISIVAWVVSILGILILTIHT
jgi:hypothetical protein